MQILFLTSRLPYPPDRGDRSRVLHFIEKLSCEHELTLVSYIAQAEEWEHLSRLRTWCQDVHIVSMSPSRSIASAFVNLWRPEPLQTLYYHSRQMQRLVDNVLDAARFDLVYVHLFRMAPYVARRSDLYRVVDLTDAISVEIRRSMPYRRLFSRILYGLEGPRIERYERWVANTFDETWMISEADRQLLAQGCPTANIHVVPIGVDADRFHPTGYTAAPNTLIFVGHLGVLHNIDAVEHLVRDVLPLVRQRIPDCTLSIVGTSPSARVRRLAAEGIVTVPGFVADLNACLNQAAVFVAPLRFCAGVQTKVLEAMAAAVPVVTTSLVNQGLSARPADEILIGDDAASMASQIVALLTDESLRTRIGQAGRRMVQQRFTWEHVARRTSAIGDLLLRPGAPMASPAAKREVQGMKRDVRAAV